MTAWTVDAANKVNEEFNINLENIGSLVKTCLKILDPELPKSVTEVSIVFTTDEEIHGLNKEYRGKDKATDVLSFSQLEGNPHPEPSTLGDIVISLETAKRQAPEFENDFNSEIKRLVVHGLLHLLGYDHEDVPKEEAEKMFGLQEELLRNTEDLKVT